MDFYYMMVPDGTYCINKYTGISKHVEFPSNITVSIMNDSLFKNHTEIESVSIPSTVTQIGGFVFDGCTNLKSVKLPPNLKDMWQYAMARTSIEEIEIPGTINRVIPFTFYNSRALKKVVFNEGTQSIDAWAFKDCTSLRDVHLPASLDKINENAFDGCGEITFHIV